MPVATVIAIIQALMGLAGQLPAIVAAAETAVELLRSGTAPTPEQEAQIMAALEEANDALQAS